VRRPDVLLALLVVAVAAGVRMWHGDLTPFLDDEASLLTRGIELLDTGRLPLVGGTFSIGIREPPLMTLLLAPLLLISRDPVWISACFSIVDAAAALFVYLTARQLAGSFAGLAAGLLYAVMPAAIFFTRHTDYYGLIPFFVALAMLSLVHAWQRRSAAALAVGLVATAFALQLHPLSATLLPVWVVVAILLARRLASYRPFIPALALIALTLAPYLYLQSRSGWQDFEGLLRFLRAPKTTDWNGVENALTLIAGGTYQQLLLPRGQSAPALLVPPSGWLPLVLVVVGAAWAALRRKGPEIIVIALLALPVLAAVRHAGGVLPYYLLPVLPPAAVLAGYVLAAVPWRAAGALLLAVPLVWQTASYVSFQSTVAAGGPSSSYGMPLRYEKQAAALFDEPPGSRVFVGQEGNQAASFPYLTGFRYQVTHSDSRYGIPLPRPAGSDTEYVVQAGGSPYLFMQSHFGPPEKVVPTTSGVPAFGLFHLPPDARARIESLPDFRPAPAGSAGALAIRGYAVSDLAAGQPSPAIIEWTVGDTAAGLPAEVQQFLHLVDAAGTTWSTDADERAYPRREWRTGDTVLSWFNLAPRADAPTGGYWLETGFYGYTTAQPVGAAARLGPVRLQGTPTAQPAAPRAVFGQQEIGLLGVQRQGLDVTLRWAALAAPRADYTVFVHLLNGAGEVVAQQDGPPRAGSYPTSLWHAGDVVADVHHLAGSAAGTTLEVGLYTQPSLQRLPVEAPDGSRLGDHVEVPA
jgi:4-amino-4-deoxy-L-arabinose transferase-like glycosyltransferase